VKFATGIFFGFTLVVLAFFALVVKAIEALAPGINDLIQTAAKDEDDKKDVPGTTGTVRYQGMSSREHPYPKADETVSVAGPIPEEDPEEWTGLGVRRSD
jgi:hypothetical protein